MLWRCIIAKLQEGKSKDTTQGRRNANTVKISSFSEPAAGTELLKRPWKKTILEKGLKSVDRLCKPVAVYLLVCVELFSVGMLLSEKWDGCGAFIVKANGIAKVAFEGPPQPDGAA